MSDNVTDEFKPNPCYWCGSETYLGSDYVRCPACKAEGPIGKEIAAIEKWNSLSARLKPAPKKVTIKRWVAIDASSIMPDGYHTEIYFEKADEGNIDTVEVEITFTDRRGVSEI